MSKHSSVLKRFSCDHKIIIVSGRIDDLRHETELWLKKFEVPFDYLFMRKRKDMRPDNVIKLEIYEEHIRDKFQIIFVLDDRQKVVDMWRGQNLVVLQCAPGNF